MRAVSEYPSVAVLFPFGTPVLRFICIASILSRVVSGLWIFFAGYFLHTQDFHFLMLE